MKHTTLLLAAIAAVVTCLLPLQSQAGTIEETRARAEQGNANAQNNLGYRYANGQGVIKDEAEAVKWHRMAAEQGNADAQANLGYRYSNGQGVTKDEAEAVKWFRKAADQGNANAQNNLGYRYDTGHGVAKDEAEAVKWSRMAAEQGNAYAQLNLGTMYAFGRGVAKDQEQAVKCYRMAAEQGVAMAQFNLGVSYATGHGVVKNEAEAYYWLLLAAAQGSESSKISLTILESMLPAAQRMEAQRKASEFHTQNHSAPEKTLPKDLPSTQPQQLSPVASGSGFFITEDGYLVTNQHVADLGTTVKIVTTKGTIVAQVVKVDTANDLSLLKAAGRFTPLPVTASRTVKLGSTVATVGFPNIGLQGYAPKLAKGDIASLTGAGDDARYFQISVPVQPGNSGGALVDGRGNVVGVVAAKLSMRAALAASETLPENVNYAVKSSYLLSFLESVPDVASKLIEPSAQNLTFEDVVKTAEQSAVLILVY